MPKDKLDKEFLRQNDLANLTERVLEAAKPYARQIGAAFVGLAIVGVGYLIYGVVAERQAAQASALLAESLRVQAAHVEEASSAEQAAAKALSKAQGEDDDDAGELKFKTHAERQTKLIAAFQQAQGAPGEIGRVAQLGEAGVLLEQGKYAQAEAIYREVTRHEGFALRFLAREGLGYALEGQKKYREALDVYKELEPKEGGFYRDRALYHQARMYEQLGDNDKAEKLYDQARKLERTPLFETINVRLTALRARKASGKKPAAGEKKAEGAKADEKKPDEKKAEKPKADGEKKAGEKAGEKQAEPQGDKPAAEKKADGKPAAEQPAKPAAAKPADPAAKPGADKPAQP